jgi:hypothetical protein
MATINAAVDGIILTADSSATLSLATSGVVRMIIDSSGNVGIAKTPTTTLDVSGAISDIAGNIRNVPSAGVEKTSVYTLAITDIGEYVTIGTGGGIDVPNGIFSAGNAVSVFNNTTGGCTISLTITTAYVTGVNTDRASVTLATRGIATILFISNSVCVLSGSVS